MILLLLLFLLCGELKVTFFYVGQGDAALIEFPGGKTMLVDAGPYESWSGYDAGSDVILPYLIENKINKIDYGVATHPHLDHIGGFLSLLDEVKFNEIWDVGFPYTTDAYYSFLRKINEKKIKYVKPYSGMKLQVDNETTILVLYPPKKLMFDTPNNNSLTFQLIHKNIVFLFTGDIEQEAENYIVSKYGNKLESHILKSPHHGSKTSSTDRFLEAVSPSIVVISCGISNRFGHPHSLVLRRYKKNEIEIYRTDIDGTIQIISDGKKYTVRKLR